MLNNKITMSNYNTTKCSHHLDLRHGHGYFCTLHHGSKEQMEWLRRRRRRQRRPCQAATADMADDSSMELQWGVAMGIQDATLTGPLFSLFLLVLTPMGSLSEISTAAEGPTAPREPGCEVTFLLHHRHHHELPGLSTPCTFFPNAREKFPIPEKLNHRCRARGEESRA